MRAKTILSILFLISLAVVAMLYLESLPKQLNAVVPISRQILIAALPLPSGTLLRTEDIAWKQTASAPEPGEISRPATAAAGSKPDLDEHARADLYGAAVRLGLAVGEPIRRSNLVRPGDRNFLQLVLAPGARAITILIGTSRASTGLLFPGDRVDVILTQTFKSDTPLPRRSVSETVAQDLRILAVGTNTKLHNVGTGSEHGVTLEVSPEQAEDINVATELGKLALALRGIGNRRGVIVPSMADVDKRYAVKPVWAGDVSPALAGTTGSKKTAAMVRHSIEIIHGSKLEVVKEE